MIAKRKRQNSLGGTTGCDVYEVRPHNSGDGVDLISDRFRYGPIWYAGPAAVPNAVAYAKYRSLSLSLAPAKDPRVGRLRRCNPDALIQRRFSPVAKRGSFWLCLRSSRGHRAKWPNPKNSLGTRRRFSAALVITSAKRAGVGAVCQPWTRKGEQSGLPTHIGAPEIPHSLLRHRTDAG